MSLTLISTTTIGAGGASSITFDSIPSTYDDLVVKYSVKNGDNYSTLLLQMYVNGTTLTNYYKTRTLYTTTPSTKTTFTGSTESNAIIGFLPTGQGTQNANCFGIGNIEIPKYATVREKTVVSEWAFANNTTAAQHGMSVSNWSGTAAITSLIFKMQYNLNFVQYSTISLYGRTNGSGGATVS